MEERSYGFFTKTKASLTLLSNNELAALYVKTRRPEIKELVVKRYEKMVHSAIQSHRNRQDYSDLAQEGMLAMLEALERYDPSKTQFSTYAYHYIHGKVRHYLRDRTGVIKVPHWIQDHYKKEMEVEARLEAELGRCPTTDELAHGLEMDAERLRHIHSSSPFYSYFMSLETMLDESRDKEVGELSLTPARLTADIFGNCATKDDGFFVTHEEVITVQQMTDSELSKTFNITRIDVRKVRDIVG